MNKAIPGGNLDRAKPPLSSRRFDTLEANLAVGWRWLTLTYNRALTDYFRADVLDAVRKVLSSDVLADGRLGVFHADNFTFGQSVFLSRIVAAAQAVEGVDAVRTDRFQRLTNPSPTSRDEGVVTIGSLEIAQLANSRTFPERGRLVLNAGGGK